MLNIFSQLKKYNASWQVVEDRNFIKEEIDSVASAVVVPSEYGLSVQFIFKTGQSSYIPLSNDASLGVGEIVDLTKAHLITLNRVEDNGTRTIYRVKA